jgi:hypothetical protein
VARQSLRISPVAPTAPPSPPAQEPRAPWHHPVIKSGVTCGWIIEASAAHFNVSVKEILGPSRLATLVSARHCAAYLMRDMRGISLPKIAKRLGRGDHTSALHAINHVKTTPRLLEAAKQIRAALTAPPAPPETEEGGARGERV